MVKLPLTEVDDAYIAELQTAVRIGRGRVWDIRGGKSQMASHTYMGNRQTKQDEDDVFEKQF